MSKLEQLLQRIDSRDKAMDDDMQPRGSRCPTGDDYNELRQDVIGTLRDVLGCETSIIRDLWWFIENVTQEDPNRQEKFFALRAQVRTYWEKR